MQSTFHLYEMCFALIEIVVLIQNANTSGAIKKKECSNTL